MDTLLENPLQLYATVIDSALLHVESSPFRRSVGQHKASRLSP